MQIFIIYLVIINLIGLFAMHEDKTRSMSRKNRISEKTFIIISVIGGSLGVFLGMHFFSHKTKHLKFSLIVPIILVIHIIIFIFFCIL